MCVCVLHDKTVAFCVYSMAFGFFFYVVFMCVTGCFTCSLVLKIRKREALVWHNGAYSLFWKFREMGFFLCGFGRMYMGLYLFLERGVEHGHAGILMNELIIIIIFWGVEFVVILIIVVL